MRSYYNIGHKLSLVGRYVTHIFLSITRVRIRKRGYHINSNFKLFSFATTAGLFIFENYFLKFLFFIFIFLEKIFSCRDYFRGFLFFDFQFLKFIFHKNFLLFIFPLTKTFYYNVEL